MSVFIGGADEDRTRDLLTASQRLWLLVRTLLNSSEQLQISHIPIDNLVFIDHNGVVSFHIVQRNCFVEFCLFGTIMEPFYRSHLF